MRFLISILTLGLSIIGYSQCPQGQIMDCNGNCHPVEWIGDGVCDDGYNFPSDFMCEEFNWDDGDCGCDDGYIQDCNGNCVLMSLIGDGFCHSSGLVNFACSEFNWDDGDCEVQCPQGQFADCDGNCWDNSNLQYLSNWHCNNTLWYGYLFTSEEIDINLDCEQLNFDGGDCIVNGCADPEAMNYYEHATADDGSCFYGDCPDGTMDCMGNCVPDLWIGTNNCAGGLVEEPEEQIFNGAYPNQLIENVTLAGNHPRGLCILPDGSAAYVGTDDGVAVVQLDGEDCSSNALIPTDGIIYSCCASNDSQYVFASNWNNPRVEVIETSSNTIVQTIPTGAGSVKMRTSFNGEWVFCSNTNSNTVSVIDVGSLELITNIPVGQMPRNIALSPDDSKLYVANWKDWTMSVVDTDSWETIAEVAVDYWPQAIWALPNNDYVLVANFGFDWTYDHISVIRTSDWQVIARLQTGAGPEDMITIGPNGEYLYVSNWGMPCCFNVTEDVCCSSEVNKGTATIIATPDFDAIVPPGSIPDPIPYIQSTLATVPLDAEYSFGMAAHPDGSAVYVVNKDSHSLSIIGFEDLSDQTDLQGDDCNNAKILTSPSFCFEDCTIGYSDDYNEMCPFDETGAADIVYRFNPQFTQTVNIDLCPSSYDTKIYIYEGTCGSYNSGQAVYCNDDFCGINGWRSRLENVTFEAGNTYFIVIDGWGSSDKGHFQICFENECPGDINGDLLVNVNDLLSFLPGFGDQFDLADLLEFLSLVGETCN